MPHDGETPAEVVADELDTLVTEQARVLVGITGPPGGGKSTFARSVVDLLARRRGDDAVALVPMDGFHLSDRVLSDLGRADRKGAPDTFDTDGFVALVERIVADADRPVYCPDFDHSMGEPIAARIVVGPAARVVVVEGNYLALDDGRWSPIAGLLARLYYVDAPADLRRTRLLERHVAAGKTLTEAQAWVDTVDEPNAELIATTRDRADLVVDGTAAS